jgi:hypothetical protein
MTVGRVAEGRRSWVRVCDSPPWPSAKSWAAARQRARALQSRPGNAAQVFRATSR